MRPSGRYPLVLLGLFLTLAAVLAWHPPGGAANWAMGNVPVLVVLPAIGWATWRFRLSPLSCTFVFLFLALHEVGVHYGYRVPFGPLDGGRNDYDRVVHVAFGLLLALPVREALVASGKARGGWATYLAGALLLANAALYEVTEWVGAELFWPQGAEDFLGFQGDALDTTKDLALALSGAAVGLSVAALVGRRAGSEA